MSGTSAQGTGGTPTPPPITRTDYFIYTSGGHREPDQVWNVVTGGKTVQIYIQGDVSSVGFPSITATHFAKKHLLSFSGGKAATAGTDITAKMQRIADKRARTGLSNAQKKDLSKIGDATQQAYWQGITNKYAGSVTKKNTFIKVDAIPPADLRKLVADALAAGDGSEAHADFPAAAVWYVEVGSTPVQLQPTGVVRLGFGYEKTPGGDKFVIKHLET